MGRSHPLRVSCFSYPLLFSWFMVLPLLPPPSPSAAVVSISLACSLVSWLVGWLAGLLAGWLTDWSAWLLASFLGRLPTAAYIAACSEHAAGGISICVRRASSSSSLAVSEMPVLLIRRSLFSFSFFFFFLCFTRRVFYLLYVLLSNELLIRQFVKTN